MNEQTFPYRIDLRMKKFLADLIGVMQRNDVRFASHVGGVQIQYLNKGANSTTVDTPISFTVYGLQISIPLNAVAKTSPMSSKWLRQYHQYISQSRGQNFTPVPQRCNVTVEARVDGTLKYYLTYMVAHEDGSLAQDMPQGRLYATEAVANIPPAEAAKLAEQAEKTAGQPEGASWLE